VQEELLIPVDRFRQVMDLHKKILNNSATGLQGNQFRQLLAEHWVVADLLQLEKKQAEGLDIRPRLSQLGLEPAEFAYVASMRRGLVGDLSLLRTEWDEIGSVAINVYKRKLFERWQHEEQLQGLFLAPQLFQIPDEPRTDAPPARRHDARSHRAWLATL